MYDNQFLAIRASYDEDCGFLLIAFQILELVTRGAMELKPTESGHDNWLG